MLASKRPPYSTDEVVPTTGVYCVFHSEHCLPQEVVLLVGNQFPRCSKCDVAVEFALVREVQTALEDHPVRIYELPDLDDGDKKADAAAGKG
jgi:hypothetical protein